jgi:hypothetical protein
MVEAPPGGASAITTEPVATSLLNRTELHVDPAPFASGVPSVTVFALRLELKPPPFGCEGGCSKVNTCMGQLPPGQAGLVPPIATEPPAEVLGLKSAVPAGDGKVLRSTRRNRNLVRGDPVLFVNAANQNGAETRVARVAMWDRHEIRRQVRSHRRFYPGFRQSPVVLWIVSRFSGQALPGVVVPIERAIGIDVAEIRDVIICIAGKPSSDHGIQ